MSIFADSDSHYSTLKFSSNASRDRFSTATSSTPSSMPTPYSLESSRSRTNERYFAEDTGYAREPKEVNNRFMNSSRGPASFRDADFGFNRATTFATEDYRQISGLGIQAPLARLPAVDRFSDARDHYYPDRFASSVANHPHPPYSHHPHQPFTRYGGHPSQYAAEPQSHTRGSRVDDPHRHDYHRPSYEYADEPFHPSLHNSSHPSLSIRSKHGYSDHRNYAHSRPYNGFTGQPHPASASASAAPVAFINNSNSMAKFLRSPQRTLFVRDLPYSCTSAALKQFCLEHLMDYLATIRSPLINSERLVESAYVCRNKEGRTQQVGYVLLSDVELCGLALEVLHLKRFLGRDIRVVMFDPKSPAEGSTTGAMHVSFQALSPEVPLITEMDLREVCEPFGAIDHVAIRTHINSSQGLQSGYGFVTFVNPELHRYCIDQIRTIELESGKRFTFSWATKWLPQQLPLNMSEHGHRRALHMDRPSPAHANGHVHGTSQFHLPTNGLSLHSGNSTIFSSSDVPDTEEGFSLVDDMLKHSSESADPTAKVPLDSYLFVTAEE